MTDYQTLWTIGQDYKEKGFYSIAIELFNEAVKHCHQDVMLRNMKLVLADTLRIMKRWEEAIKVYFEIEEYGTIGNIKLYLGETEEALKWYEEVNSKKGYIYYKYPEAIFLIGKYDQTLDFLIGKYARNKIFETQTKCLLKKDLEFLLLCFEKVYNIYEEINVCSSICSSLDKVASITEKMYKVNPLSFTEHERLFQFLIKEYGNIETLLINLQRITSEKYQQKIKNRITRIYSQQIWCLDEFTDQNLFCSNKLLLKIIHDRKFAEAKSDDIYLEHPKTRNFYDWRSYKIKSSESNDEIKGTDIFHHFSYYLPRSSIIHLFPNETIEYIDQQINSFQTKMNQTICNYLTKFLAIQTDFYSQSDRTMKDLLANLNKNLQIKLGISSANDKWVKEVAMVKLISQWFVGYEIITQASPDWLKPQRLDLLLPELTLAVEYQGEQHFKPVEIFGGEEGFKQNQERDERKKKLCNANGIAIEYINYDQDILERVKEIYYQYYLTRQ